MVKSVGERESHIWWPGMGDSHMRSQAALDPQPALGDSWEVPGFGLALGHLTRP